MRILFCDDDTAAVDQLIADVTEYFIGSGCPIPKIAKYSSGDELLEYEKKADIVFLDVEMPGQNGIKVGQRLMSSNPNTKIFIVTNYHDYLDDAMDFNVFRYLQKPVDKDRLFRGLEKACKLHWEKAECVDICTKDTVESVASSDIMCIESRDKKTIIHTINGDYTSSLPLNHWLKVLDISEFIQSHRSFIINLKYVRKLDHQNVILKHGDLEISAYLAGRKWSKIKNEYLLYRGRGL